MDAATVGGLLSGFVTSITSQITTNLPAILVFIAGITFLMLGVRWVKRAVRG